MMHEPHSQDLAPPLLMDNNCAGHRRNYYMNSSNNVAYMSAISVQQLSRVLPHDVDCGR